MEAARSEAVSRGGLPGHPLLAVELVPPRGRRVLSLPSHVVVLISHRTVLRGQWWAAQDLSGVGTVRPWAEDMRHFFVKVPCVVQIGLPCRQVGAIRQVRAGSVSFRAVYRGTIRVEGVKGPQVFMRSSGKVTALPQTAQRRCQQLTTSLERCKLGTVGYRGRQRRSRILGDTVKRGCPSTATVIPFTSRFHRFWGSRKGKV